MALLEDEQQPPTASDPRAWMLTRFAEYVREAQRRSATLFNIVPATPVEVRREPELTERTASARYTSPTPDGSRPGIFWVPLPGPTFEVMGMKAVAIHEAVPGHHFQLPLNMERPDTPRWRGRVFGGATANTEGWALYAEKLAIDEGWYEGDPVQLLGALDARTRYRLRHRCARSGTLCGVARSGMRLHDRHAAHREAARRSEGVAGRDVQPARVPRQRAEGRLLCR